jgi:outer membrane protein insertion porin family
MTPSNDQSRSDRLLWLGLLLLVASGCAHLAPGIAPIPSDPPETAAYGVAGLAPLVDENEVVYEDSPAVEDAGYLSDLDEGDLIPVADGGDDRYIARQFPQTYNVPVPPANPNPGATSLPPSVYQLPRNASTPPSLSTAPQVPSYQAPQSLPVPLTGVPVQQSQPLPPPINAAPPQMPGYQSPNLPAPSLGAPVPGAPTMGGNGVGANGLGGPIYGEPVYGDPILGPQGDPYAGMPSSPPVYVPNTRTADLEIIGYPARTGRLMFGGAVNSDAGVTGQVTIDERNFDITRWPSSFRDLASGTAFRGAGQTLRLEAVPGSQFKRYTASFADPNLFGYLPISFGLSGFLYDRRYQDYDEERLGGRVSFGYRVTPDLSLTTAINGQNVEISNPRVLGVSELDDVLGDNQLYTGEFRLTHDTRDSPFQPAEGHFFEFGYEKAFGDFDYSRFEVENRNYLLLAQRADGSGKQTISLGTRLGFSGEETPLFENYFAGGYSTLRGFDFRGASPVESGVQVGGRFQWLNTLEYMFPITADDAFRGVAFVDFGTVERDIEINKENFRVAPGLGLRISIPMLGPAPLAFDFAYPVTKADTDDKRIFSFYMSALR